VLRGFDYLVASLGPWLVHNARFRFRYALTGLAAALIGHFWAGAEPIPGPRSLGATVKRQLILLSICFVIYILLWFAFEDWIPMLVARSPGIYNSATFIEVAAWIHAVSWGSLFLVLTRLLTLVVRAGSREDDSE